MKLLPEFWQKHFLLIELVLSIVVAISFAVWIYHYDGAITVDAVLKGGRASIYGTIASILGSLLGFTITATSLVLGFSVSDKLTVLRESREYPKLWRTFSSTIWALAFTTVVSLVCLLFDKETEPTMWLLLLFVWALTFTLLRIARTIWALEHIIELVTKR